MRSIITQSPVAALLIEAAAINIGASYEKVPDGQATIFTRFQNAAPRWAVVTAETVMDHAIASAASVRATRVLQEEVRLA